MDGAVLAFCGAFREIFIMRKFIVAASTALISGTALAAPLDYGPQASLFFSMSFAGETAPAAERSRFGLRMDHDWREHYVEDAKPLLEFSFGMDHFQAMSVAGQPIVSREMILRQDDEGGVFQFAKDNFGWIALGIGGAILVYGVVDGESNKDDRSPSDINGPGAPNGAGVPGQDGTDCSSPNDGLPGSNTGDCAQNPGTGAGGGGDTGGGGLEVPDFPI